MKVGSRESGAVAAVVVVSAWAAVGVAAAESSAIPTRLLGVYAATFVGNENKVPGAEGPSAGRWLLEIRGSGVFFSNPNSGESFPVGPGRVGVSGRRITFGADPKCPVYASQTGSITKGVYTFSLQGRTLRFKKVSDSCIDRAVTLTAHPWKRQ